MPYKDITSLASASSYVESQSVEIPITLNHLPSQAKSSQQIFMHIIIQRVED